jgi:hypothetical protein
LKDFVRSDLSFSLCGLNCALCTMKLGGYCPGCGGGAGNQSCAIARCSLKHGGCDYCFACREYPCAQYDGFAESDSFITHRNQGKDMEKARKIGVAAYRAELNEKADLLRYLLENFDDGRRKTFFCLAVNLLECPEIRAAIQKAETELLPGASEKERAALVVRCFAEAAEQNGIPLKLRKKKDRPEPSCPAEG